MFAAAAAAIVSPVGCLPAEPHHSREAKHSVTLGHQPGLGGRVTAREQEDSSTSRGSQYTDFNRVMLESTDCNIHMLRHHSREAKHSVTLRHKPRLGRRVTTCAQKAGSAGRQAHRQAGRHIRKTNRQLPVSDCSTHCVLAAYLQCAPTAYCTSRQLLFISLTSLSLTTGSH